MTTKPGNTKGQDVFQPKLYLAFELSNTQWKLGFTIGHRKQPRLRTITAGDLMTFQEEVRRAKERFRLPETIQVVSCYEAGRDGFWLHRYLATVGIVNLIELDLVKVNAGHDLGQGLAVFEFATAGLVQGGHGAYGQVGSLGVDDVDLWVLGDGVKNNLLGHVWSRA